MDLADKSAFLTITLLSNLTLSSPAFYTLQKYFNYPDCSMFISNAT